MGYFSAVTCWFYYMIVMILINNEMVVVFAQRRQDINGRCRILNDCKPIGYYCAKNSTCQCRPGYIPDEQWIQCLGYVGSICVYDDHCITGAYCTRGPDNYERCQCKVEDNYYPVENTFLCSNSAAPDTFNKSATIALFSLIFSTILFTKLFFNT